MIAARIYLIRCYAKNVKRDLTADEKKRLRQIAAQLNRKPNSKNMDRMQPLVTSDPEIMRGSLVFIPMDLVADMLDPGATATEILEGYPTLNQEMISLAPKYMRVFPRSSRASRMPGQGRI